MIKDTELMENPHKKEKSEYGIFKGILFYLSRKDIILGQCKTIMIWL